MQGTKRCPCQIFSIDNLVSCLGFSDRRNTNKFTERREKHEKIVTQFLPNSQLFLVLYKQHPFLSESSEGRVGTRFSVKSELPSISFLGSPWSLKLQSKSVFRVVLYPSSLLGMGWGVGV